MRHGINHIINKEMKKQAEINTKVLEVLLDIIHEENLPINVEVGERFVNDNGSSSADVLFDYESEHSSLFNETMCKAINLTFDLTDN